MSEKIKFCGHSSLMRKCNPHGLQHSDHSPKGQEQGLE